MPAIMQRLQAAAGPLSYVMTAAASAASSPGSESSPGRGGESSAMSGCQALGWLLAALTLAEARSR